MERLTPRLHLHTRNHPRSPIFAYLRWGLFLLLLPGIILSSENSYYALYREAEQRCLTINSTALLHPGDHIYGGPFGIQEAISVLREKCPVPFHEETDWFAVSRNRKCWLVKNRSRLIPGDIIWRGNISRSDAESLLLKHCDQFEIDEKKADPEISIDPPSEPRSEYQWSATAVPWITLYATPQSSIETKEVNPEIKPPSHWKNLTPFVSIEPEDFSSAPGGVRVELPDTLVRDGENPNNVALAFFEESWSQSGNSTDARWRLHAVEHNTEAGTFEAELHHASVIGLVIVGGGLIATAGASALYDEAVRKLMDKRASDHFVLHYKPEEIPDDTVNFTLKKLEESRRLLTTNTQQGGLGLSYPAVPVKLDVYYVDLRNATLYGKYCQGKSGARWIDLNLPKKVSGFSRKTLSATIAHELFHFVQFPYEGYSTLKNAWWGKATGGEFPYGWLNEALSSWIELYAVKDPAFAPSENSPILDSDLYIQGLKGLKKTSQGYSAGLFIDFLVRRYEVEIIRDILGECRRQVESGTARDPYTAVRRAVSRRALQVKPDDRLFRDMDAVWQSFSEEFIAENGVSKALDRRVNRKIPYTSGRIQPFTAGENPSNQAWSIAVPPLSLVPLASRTYKITPSGRDPDGDALVDCKADLSREDASAFEISTLVYESERIGKTACISDKSRMIGQMNRSKLSTSFTLTFRKENRARYLFFIPIGLGAGSSASSENSAASYKLSCKLRKKEEIPEFGLVSVSTNAIEDYYRALLNTVVTMKAKPGSRIHEVCPGCGDLYRKAIAEFTPLANAISQFDEKHYKREDAWRVMTDLTIKYYDKCHDREQEIDDDDRRIINRFVEISGAISDVYNTCAFSAARTYILLPYLSGAFPITPSLVATLCRSDRGPVPSVEQLEKRFKSMRKELSHIAACRKATKFIEPYLRENRDEVIKNVEKLKAKYPWLQ